MKKNHHMTDEDFTEFLKKINGWYHTLCEEHYQGEINKDR